MYISYFYSKKLNAVVTLRIGEYDGVGEIGAALIRGRLAGLGGLAPSTSHEDSSPAVLFDTSSPGTAVRFFDVFEVCSRKFKYQV